MGFWLEEKALDCQLVLMYALKHLILISYAIMNFATLTSGHCTIAGIRANELEALKD